MTALFSLGVGLALTLAGWGAARAVAGARMPRGSFAPLILLHDGLAPAGTFLLLLAMTGRPLLSGLASFSAFAGFAFADHVKRAVLREPIVFTDMSEVVELFRHPDFYFPFAGTGRVLSGAAAVAGLFGVLFFWEAPLFPATVSHALLFLGAAVAAIACLAFPFSQPWARLLRRFATSGDPIADAKTLGPFAMILTYGGIARAERAARRATAKPLPAEKLLATPPVILVQSESFFDAARLGVGENYLPSFRATCDAGQSGRLTVPCWGANTTRTEFAVLSGLSPDEIGFDHFNPYHAFARAGLPSLAQVFKVQGYRTICLHPFDLNFYNRDRLMPLLGFDILMGVDAFAGCARSRGYVTDAEVGRVCARLLGETTQPLFIFIITMENHGPWKAGAALDDGMAEYLQALKGADAMIAILRDALERDGRNGMLGFYGDHMPSLPDSFASLNFTDTQTDYFLWRPGMTVGARCDIAAHDLPRALLARLSEPA